MESQVLSASDHYCALQVAHDAATVDVKRAYRRLSLELHPDRNANPSAEEAFQRIAEAHEILCDPRKRLAYDASLQQVATEAAADKEARAQARNRRATGRRCDDSLSETGVSAEAVHMAQDERYRQIYADALQQWRAGNIAVLILFVGVPAVALVSFVASLSTPEGWGSGAWWVLLVASRLVGTALTAFVLLWIVLPFILVPMIAYSLGSAADALWWLMSVPGSYLFSPLVIWLDQLSAAGPARPRSRRGR